MSQVQAFSAAKGRLVELGLDEPLAAAYLQLLVHGKSRPSAVAKALEVSRAEAYRRLDALAQWGLAAVNRERPTTYEPRDPADAFAAIRRRHEADAQAIEKVQRSLEADQPVQWSDVAATGTFRHVVGRGAFLLEIQRLLEDAEREVMVVNPEGAGTGLADGFLHRPFQRVATRGIEHRILSTVVPTRGLWDAERVRLLSMPARLPFAVIDGELVAVSVGNMRASAMPMQTVLVTAAPGFVGAYRMLFDRLWQGASRTSPASAGGADAVRR